MANYARERSRYGGYPGSIIIHSTPGIGSLNDPTSAVFRDNLPAGYLKCDGSVQNAKDYYALAQILGVGDESRFRRETDNLRNSDPTTGDLGQFRLPDLGSKVIIGGRNSGVYNNDFVETDVEQVTPINRVGPQIDVVSNVGSRINTGFTGPASIVSESDIPMIGAPKYNLARKTSETTLTIENFQGHAHDSNQAYLNYSASHQVGGDGGKDRQTFSGNSGAGNEFGDTQDAGRESVHAHNITRPFQYSYDFRYAYPGGPVDMSGVTAYVDVDLSNEKKLDQLVTPFILVEYLIRF
jgi:hypothetical protein